MNKNFKSSLALLALSPFVLPGCAMLTKYKCNREYAANKGMEDAAAGRVSRPGALEGNSCEGEYSGATFSKDYAYGFEQKQKELCQKASVGAWGKADGEQGLANQPQAAKLALCSQMPGYKGLTAEYESQFKKSYCSALRAEKWGETQGKAMQKSMFDGAFSGCSSAQLSSLKKIYAASYTKAIAGQCLPEAAKTQAGSDVRAKVAMDAGLAKFENCPASARDKAMLAYKASYAQTQILNQQEEAKRQAEAAKAARLAKEEEFKRTTAASSFAFNNRSFTAACSVAPDKSFVQVEVANPYPEQVLIQGNWKMIYFNNDFQKITEDRTLEALLLTGGNKKTFQKLTLPRDATFCRSEYIGAGV